METKNMILNNKKGTTILNIFLVTIIGIFIITAAFSFVNDNANEAQVTIPTRYNDTLNDLDTNQEVLSNNVDDIRDSINDIKEADSTIQSAFFGLKGALALFKLPLNIFDSVIGSVDLTFGLFDGLNKKIINSILLVITIIVVFAFLRFITQRGNDA